MLVAWHVFEAQVASFVKPPCLLDGVLCSCKHRARVAQVSLEIGPSPSSFAMEPDSLCVVPFHMSVLF